MLMCRYFVFLYMTLYLFIKVRKAISKPIQRKIKHNLITPLALTRQANGVRKRRIDSNATSMRRDHVPHGSGFTTFQTLIKVLISKSNKPG